MHRIKKRPNSWSVEKNGIRRMRWNAFVMGGRKKGIRLLPPARLNQFLSNSVPN